MARSKLLLSTSLCLVFSIPAYAQNKTFGQIDTNSDGSLSRNELASAFGTRGADRVLGRSDRDNDSMVSLAEARSSHDSNEGDDDEGDDGESDDGESNSGGHNESDDGENSESDDGESDGESDGENDDGGEGGEGGDDGGEGGDDGGEGGEGDD